MGENSKIEWCHHTFNLVWGCTKVSPACQFCYAEAWAKRTGFDVWGADKPRRTFGEKHWQEPLKWNAAAKNQGERKRVFCSSMADVFEDHPTLATERDKLFELIHQTPWLDWLLLTKRPENMNQFTPESWQDGWPKNVWAGTTAENQEWAEKRIRELRKVPARVRFLSCEPLLGPITLGLPCDGEQWECVNLAIPSICSKCGRYRREHLAKDIQWVIAGGESGGHARPSQTDWFRYLRGQCAQAEVAFHFKQFGDWLPADQLTPNVNYGSCRHESLPNGSLTYRVGKKAAGRMLDGREWNEFPEAV